jgi:glycosyltransferase involved in cell wall biosynthesis
MKEARTKARSESLRSSARSGLASLDIMAVIPSFKQPGFLSEALESVLAQRGDARVGGVIVDDGCPFEQTRSIGLSFARRYSDRIVYLRRANGGLSAARNTGVDFVLSALPDCRSIYLLDADNRLRPDFLNRAQKVLDEVGPEIGWVYPDFDMFGFGENYSARGRYSYFMHLLENYCEAGSLVRRSVFESGLRYDEEMRAGFEDWDFWLRSAQRGFRGKHLAASGFLYRKRAESMLASSERVRGVILGGMRVRYGKHLTVRALARLEAAEVPRFGLYVSGDDTVRYVLDPVAEPLRAESRVAARTSFVESRQAPQSEHFPPFCCFASQEALDLLARAGMLRNLFYQAQIALRDAHFVAVSISWSGLEEMGLRHEPAPAPRASAREAPIMFARTALLGEAAKDPSPGWVRSIVSDSPGPLLARLGLTLPESLQMDLLPAAPPMLEEIDGMRERMLTRSILPADWRAEWRRSRLTAHEAYDELTGCGAILPHLGAGNGRDIGFVLPLFEFGGVERVVFNYAAAMRRMGWRCHLFISGSDRIKLFDRHAEIFETVNFFFGEGIEGGDYNKLHFGACVSGFAIWRDTRDAVGLLSTMDVVLNTHALGGHGIMQALRKQNVKTYLGLHLVEKGPLGQPMGNPHIALAYEGAYDGFVVISEKLRDWCVGQAVPEQKVIKITNAPSYEADPDQVAAALASRPGRAGSPLRVLYLGRLDVQKGLERLRDVVLQTLDPAFEWRLVGRAVLNDSALDLSTTGIPIEPPAMTGPELDALYAWADVVVLPSRFEGVPLTILEAQRFGCVMIATDVGAVSEIIEDGVDGFLVPVDRGESAVVSEFVARLSILAADRDLCLRVGETAAQRVAASSWEYNMRDWVEQLETGVARAA